MNFSALWERALFFLEVNFLALICLDIFISSLDSSRNFVKRKREEEKEKMYFAISSTS